MGRSSDGSIQHTMSSLMRGCFGYCHNSNKSSNKASKDTKRLPTIHRKGKHTEKSDESETAICKSKETKQHILSRARENARWRLLKTTASAFFLRNVNVDRQYFKALKTEGLLVTVVSSVKCPVLNIAWFFTDGELTNTRQSFHRSFQKSNWDIVICEGITEEMKTNFNYDKINEPILDGIPCSYWLSVIEPTIPMILELFSRRHRKTNLSRLRVLDGIYDELVTRHGDTFLEQLDPDMYGPHQVLVNRVHATPFPTMELGATAALVHNAMVSREHQFQEPFRSRRPNHRSRCTRRPRPPPQSGHGWTPAVSPEDSADSHNSTAPTLVGDPGYHEIMTDLDPNWYIPFILQLAAFSTIQLPDVDDSSDDDVAGCSGMATTSLQLQTASNEGYDQNIAGCSRMDADINIGVSDNNSDVVIVGCSWMGTEPNSTDDVVTVYKEKTSSISNVEVKIPQSSFTSEDEFLARKRYFLSAGSGFINHKSEIDDVFCIEENTGERLEKLHEIVEEGNVNEYVDFILENAVLSLGSSQVSVEDHSELSSRHLDAADITEPIQSLPTGMTYGSDVVGMSTHDMEKQTIPYTSVRCPNNYHDECVVDEMAAINLNQSASDCGYISYHGKCSNSLNQKGRMFHLDLHSSRQTVLPVQREMVVPETDHLNREHAMLNVNQSALYLHTHHRLRNRCGYSPDTWFHDPYEQGYRPAKLRPNEKTIHAWKKSIRTYIRGISDANISHPPEPAILRIFDGSHGPVARRFFVRCATEWLQEMDERKPWRWKPTNQQIWEFRNRPELSPSGPEIANKKHKSVFEKSQGKNAFLAEQERKNSKQETTLRYVSKKRKNKWRNVSQTPKSREKTEMSTPNDGPIKETMDVPAGTKMIIKTDVKGKREYQSQSRGYDSMGKYIATEGTRNTCGVEHGFDETTTCFENGSSTEEMLETHKQLQTNSLNSAGKDEKLTRDIEVALVDQHGIGKAGSAVRNRYSKSPDIPLVDTVPERRSKTANSSNDSCDDRKSTLRPMTDPKQHTIEENLLYSNRKQQPQSTRKTCKGSIQGSTTNIGVPTKEQACNRRRSIIRVRECEREKSTDSQSSNSTEEMSDTYNCVTTFEEDSDIHKNDNSHRILSSSSVSQRRRNSGYKKYTSSENDADLSSSDCNEEPRRKSKIRCKKKRSSSAHRKETAEATETGLDNPGVRSCYLSKESKEILASLQHDTPKDVSYGEESSSGKDICEFVSVCNKTMTASNVSMSQVSDGSIKSQSNETVVWAFSETDTMRSECGEEMDEDSDTDSTDFWPSCTSVHVSRKSDFEDTVSEEDDVYTEESLNESNDSCWTEDFNYDTDASSSISLLGDEGYLIVNISDTFHSESVTSASSEIFTNHTEVRSSLSEISLESRSFRSPEYSSVHQDDCTTAKINSLCYKSAGFYFSQKSDSSFQSNPNKSTSLVDNSSACVILDSGRIVSGDNSNEETGRNNTAHSLLEIKSNTGQDPNLSSSLKVNCRTSRQSFNTQHGYSDETCVTTQVNGASRDIASFDSTEASRGSSAGIQEHGENNSNNEERPDNSVEQHLRERRHHDVGDQTTSVDEVRRHRESRRQRGILQYQWNGIYALSRMFDNRVGQRIRRYRIWLRAWLDRRQQWLQRHR